MGPNEAALRKALDADPEQVRTQADAWEKGAGDLRLVAERLRTKQAQLKAAWPAGQDGEAATAAFENLASYVDTQAERMDQGAKSYRTAARALAEAQADYGSLPTPPGGAASLGEGATPQQAKQADRLQAAGAAEREQKAGEYLQVMEGRFDSAQGQMKEAAPYDSGVSGGQSGPRDQGYAGDGGGSYSAPGTGGTGPYSTSTSGTFAGTAVGLSALQGRPVLGGTVRPGNGQGVGDDGASADGVLTGSVPTGTAGDGSADVGTTAAGAGPVLGGSSGGAMGAGGAAAILGGGKGLLGRMGGAASGAKAGSAGSAAAARSGGAPGRAAGATSAARGGAIGGRAASPSQGVLGGRSAGSPGASSAPGQSAAGGATGQGAGARGATAGGQQAGGRSAGGQSGRAGGAGGRGAAPGTAGQGARGTQQGREERSDKRPAMMIDEDWLDDDEVAPDVLQ